MSYAQCLNAKYQAGKLRRTAAQKAQHRYDAFRERARRDGHPDPDRAARAAVDAEIERDMIERAFRTATTVRRGKEILHRMETAPTKWEGVKGVMNDWDYETRANVQVARGIFLDGLRELGQGSKAQRLATSKAMIHELFQEGAAPEAAHLVKAWRDTVGHLVARFREAGGDLIERMDWHLPQTHSIAAMAKRGKAAWVEAVLPKLDLDRMGTLSQGKPFTVEELRPILEDAYDTIITGGLNKMTPSGSGGSGKSVAKAHTDARFLQFKDADGWLDYNAEFGSSNPLEAMINHMDRMSQEIATMRAFGPSPAGMKNFVRGVMQTDIAKAAPTDLVKKTEQVAEEIDALDRYFDVLTGASSRVVSPSRAKFWSELRAWISASQLGSAVVSALGDTATLQITAAVNDLPQMKMWKRALPLMLSHSTRTEISRMGFIGDRFVSSFRENKWHQDVMEATYGGKALDLVMRKSGLVGLTNAMRDVFQLELAGALTEDLMADFVAMAPKRQAALRKVGVTDNDWNALRKAGDAIIEKTEDGATFVNFVTAAKHESASIRNAAIKLHSYVIRERDHAVTSPSAWDEAVAQGLPLLRGGPKGTLRGEISRTAFGMYKGFAISYMVKHLGRMMQQSSWQGRVGYGVALAVGMTPFGLLRYQSDQLFWGRDMLSMDPTTAEGRSAWAAGFLRGGGLGIIGDFMFDDYSRFGHGPFETASGPGVGLASDLAKLTLGNVSRAIQGKDTNVAGQAFETARRYVPGGNVWWLRVPFQRVVLDQLSKLIDPSIEQKWARQERKRKKNTGQGSWWRAGDLTPNRAPEVVQ